LKDRVDKGRVRLIEATLGEGVMLHRAVTAFAAEIEALARAGEEDSPDLLTLCRARQEAADATEAV